MAPDNPKQKPSAGSTYTSGVTSPGYRHLFSPAEEDRYWEETYSSRDYVDRGVDYDTYRPAYRYGMDSYRNYGGKPFGQLDESALKRGWDELEDRSEITWERAKNAVRDAYDRLLNREGSMRGQK